MLRSRDAKLDYRNKVRSYRELVLTAVNTGLTLKTYGEYSQNKEQGKVCLLRHDVDRSLDRALMLAEIEAAMGWRSTYFMLHPGDDGTSNYYGEISDGRVVHHPEFFARCREMQDMGHEVGLHNDFMLLSLITRRPVIDLIRDELAAFDDAGIRIHGSASHGSFFAREHHFANYEIFSHCVSGGREKGRVLEVDGWNAKLHSISLEELGLKYEAYFLPRNITFSDSGGSIVLASGKDSRSGVDFDSDESMRTLADVIRARPDPRLVMLMHPCWWECV
jgi:hypothetical protein